MKGNSSILIIEDDHDMRVCFRQILEDLGFKVHTAANGKDGLTTLSCIPTPKLIILDLSMPIMNGEEFLEFKARIESIRSVPILIVTGDMSKIEASMVEENVMLKPIETDSFIHKVSNYI